MSGVRGNVEAGAPIVVALGAVALMVIPIAAPGDLVPLLWIGAALAVATVAAFRSGVAPAIRAVLLSDAMLLMVVLGGIAVWPAPVVVALGLLWIATRRFPSLAPAAGWAVRGRLTREVWLLMIGTIVLSAVALVGWSIAVRPEVSPYLRWMSEQPPWLIAGGLLVFAVLNAVGEEILFRGIFQSELRAVTSASVAVLATSVAFGVAHATGFPSGGFGMLMAGVYAVALGIIRIRSRGMLGPILTHMAADTTIGLIAVVLLT